jgi:hypothetical protein
MMVNLYNVLTVIAVVWIAVILLTMMLGDDFAMIICVLVSMASVGLLLYRLGEFMKLLVGG